MLNTARFSRARNSQKKRFGEQMTFSRCRHDRRFLRDTYTPVRLQQVAMQQL